MLIFLSVNIHCSCFGADLPHLCVCVCVGGGGNLQSAGGTTVFVGLFYRLTQTRLCFISMQA